MTSRQRAQLRSLAHYLKPVLHLGKDGLTAAAVHALEDAFRTRELLKVKVQEAAPLSAREAGAALEAALADVHHVSTIGRTVILYRRHPEQPEIKL